MVILGVSDGVDAGAALVIDTELVAVAEQERHDQVARSRAFPWSAIEDVLGQSGIRPRDVDVIAVAGRFSPPFFLRRHPGLRAVARDAFSSAIDAQVFFQAMLRQTGLGALEADRASEWLEGRFRARGFVPQRVTLVDIHKCLAEAAYRCQPDEQVLVIALHPMGDGVAVSVHRTVAGQVDLVWEQKGFSSLHTHVHRCMTAMGLRPLVDEDIVWARAARGTPDAGLVAHLGRHLRVVGPRLSRRAYPLPAGTAVYRRLREVDTEVAAASLLENLRRAVCDLVRHHVRVQGVSDVVLCGAIFDNPRLCGSVMALEEVTSLRVGPAPGWSSLAAGAAMTEGGSAPCQLSASLGRGVVSESCEKALRVAGMSGTIPSDPVAAMVERLAAGNVVARFAGRAGVGRAGVGAHAVLCRADAPAAVATARAALGRSDDVEPACLWMDTPGDGLADGRDWLAKLSGSARYGTVAVPVDDRFASRYPAAVTPDGRVLLQQLFPEDDPFMHAVLTALHEATGCAALAAFPLSWGQEPPVALPADAIRIHRRSGLEFLFLGDHLVEGSG